MSDRDPTNPNLSAILGAIETAVTPATFAWLREGVEQLARGLRDPDDRLDQLATRSAGALRRLGGESLRDAALPLATSCGTIDAGRWSRGDAGRACLLLAATDHGAPGWDALVRAYFRRGDEVERAAAVRALCLLPEPCALRNLALEAGRINSMRLYAALALDNPYPAACYDEHAFNQVVLKCLFNGLPIERISGLLRRANPELSRMCEDYVAERVAAGRGVPSDVWLALEPHATARGLALTLEYLEHPEPSHRLYAVRALARRRVDARITAALAERLDHEDNDIVRRALAAACD